MYERVQDRMKTRQNEYDESITKEGGGCVFSANYVCCGLTCTTTGTIEGTGDGANEYTGLAT